MEREKYEAEVSKARLEADEQLVGIVERSAAALAARDELAASSGDP
jgi:hypothetical protein